MNPQQLNHPAILSAIQAGQAVLVGEWRGAKPDVVKYTDKKTGQAKSFSKLTHVIECGENKTFESVSVTEMLPDGTDVEKLAIPFKRGEIVLVAVKSIQMDFGKRDVSAFGMLKLA